jgi:phosphoribosyl-ATP pyrophosphohydrolase
MNLSHVERYFADFLSTMESGDSIPLHKITPELGKDPIYVPKSIKLPKIHDFTGDIIESKIYSVDILNDNILILSQGEKGGRSIDTYKNGKLEKIIDDRYKNPVEGSYVDKLRAKGINKIAQKVGEEGVETVIAALNETEHDFINEASDLIFHLLVLMREKNVSLSSIAKNLENRNSGK